MSTVLNWPHIYQNEPLEYSNLGNNYDHVPIVESMSNVEDIHGFDWPKRKLTNVNALNVFFLIDRTSTRFSLLICEFFFKTIYLFHTRAKRVGDFFCTVHCYKTAWGNSYL